MGQVEMLLSFNTVKEDTQRKGVPIGFIFINKRKKRKGFPLNVCFIHHCKP